MKRILKYLGLSIAGIIVGVTCLLTYLYLSADMKNPNIPINLDSYTIEEETGYTACNGNFFRKSNSGLYEIFLHGKPLDRGTALGRLTKDLLYYQEKTFVNQIREIIPSESYLKFLRFFTVIFNRNMGEFVPEEYRQEIYGMSLSCSDEFNSIGPAYERQLNFHGAHDIGHTMQEYMLVGCSSFGVWGNKSADSTLIIGRNFDFYVGDEFAKNKLVSFVAPDKGYKYASIGWAGMIGVLSGMNEKGLTITLNAAKGDIPTSAAMPISILAREILQYASTIDEAYKIAKNRQTFVSESLLIGSAIDGKAAIIEKTPSQIDLFETTSNQIVCTNHYQSELLKNNPKNLDNIKTSDSPYRFRRMEELLAKNAPITPTLAANILRNRLGEKDTDIGFTNEKSLNQDIAHHSVIFKPSQLLMWVSTSPWQSGQYVCYDLKTIFNNTSFLKEIKNDSLTIVADSIFLKNDYNKVVEFRKLAKEIKLYTQKGVRISNEKLDYFKSLNPNHYYSYALIGDYHNHFKEYDLALQNYQMALSKEIPRENERNTIENKIKKINR